ncbi:MFS transporter [Micromonospora sp. R77]|uniref:MFS transporter n=1 Tax=Micromonospora sp. R77 TaxID=2925836 RepID=UPI001F61AA4F|nr:MFS transporter [Micromonospora sp. R77]MCI4066790.1 MFS transporter [Micromonospora sp. R77]
MKESFGALVERPFRLMWIGVTSSAVGDATIGVALVFAVLSVGGSATDLGAILAISTIVRVLLLIFGGALADRMSRRLLMVGSDLFMLAVQAGLGLILLTGRGSVAILMVASVCAGAASAVSKPAFTGLVPQTISKPRLQQANALMDMSRSGAEILGPALTGLAIATTSVGWVYLVDALSYGISALALSRLSLPPIVRTERNTFLTDLVIGWRQMASRTWYWVALCGHAVWNLGSVAFWVLGPIIVAKEAGGASSWGAVAAAMAVGALLGGAVALRLRPRRPLVVGHLALLLTGLGIASLIGPAPVVLTIVAALMGAAGVAFVNNVWTTVVQRLIPEEVLSRVSSYDWLVSFTIAPLGYALVGPLSDHIGRSTTLEIALGVIVLGVVMILMVPKIRQLRQGPDGELFGWPEHQVATEPATAGATASGGTVRGD